ncbi:MAG: hypothetical protein JXB30_07465 [Anaerolineae bacterium]|nr:hypothetical protein [Anaerolineae bacterium]
MPHSTHGTIVLMGSGEMAASMVEVHKYAMSLVEGPVQAAFIDTPAGFQLNADALSEKAFEYFRDRLDTPLTITSFKSTAQATLEQTREAVRKLHKASYIFAGPGSPTYALRNWRHTPVLDAILETLARGGCLVFSSAAALTVGRLTIPIYEIYKVGEALRWVEGMDILGHNGMDVCIVPHWNNNSGGDHDTRYCYMGEPRWAILEKQLPSMTTVLGIDEHTACIIRLPDNRCEVQGVGRVTVRGNGTEQVFSSSGSFDLDLLRPDVAAGRFVPVDAPEIGRLTWDDIRSSHEKLLAAPEPSPEGVAAYIYDLMTFMSTAREHGDTQTMRLAEEAMREALVGIVARLGAAPGNSEEIIAPYIDLLIELRASFRAAKQWEQADLIRERLTDLGILLEDEAQGTRWRQLS